MLRQHHHIIITIIILETITGLYAALLLNDESEKGICHSEILLTLVPQQREGFPGEAVCPPCTSVCITQKYTCFKFQSTDLNLYSVWHFRSTGVHTGKFAQVYCWGWAPNLILSRAVGQMYQHEIHCKTEGPAGRAGRAVTVFVPSRFFRHFLEFVDVLLFHLLASIVLRYCWSFLHLFTWFGVVIFDKLIICFPLEQ